MFGEIKRTACNHEIDDTTKRFVEGKGFVGVCKFCGVKLVRARFASVRPRNRPHMSKKERLRERRLLK